MREFEKDMEKIVVMGWDCYVNWEAVKEDFEVIGFTTGYNSENGESRSPFGDEDTGKFRILNGGNTGIAVELRKQLKLREKSKREQDRFDKWLMAKGFSSCGRCLAYDLPHGIGRCNGCRNQSNFAARDDFRFDPDSD